MKNFEIIGNKVFMVLFALIGIGSACAVCAGNFYHLILFGMSVVMTLVLRGENKKLREEE